MATKKGTVTAAKVAATLTDYPAYVDLAAVGVTTLAEAQSVRVYSDAGLTTELAREIVSVTEMHVKVPSLTTSTSIWVDYDGVRSDYAVTDTYGAEAVWMNGYEAVYHLQADPSGNITDSIKDSTSNGRHLTPSGSPVSEPSSPISGNGVAFDGVDDMLTDTDWTWLANSGVEITVSFWNRVTSADSQESIAFGFSPSGNERFQAHTPWSNDIVYWDYGTCCVDGRLNGTAWGKYGNWTNVFMRAEGGSASGNGMDIWLDDVLYASDTKANEPSSDLNGFRIGSAGLTGEHHHGDIDEFRLSSIWRSNGWKTTEYNNQNDVATFWTWEKTVSTFKAIPVNAAKVAATLADYPAYVKPSAMTGWGALSLTQANSIRFYSDEAKTTELAREVVSADEIHVKVPSLTTTTIIYADYDGIRADYAVTDTYGAEAVWTSDHSLVAHQGGGTDSTANGNNGAAYGGVTEGGAAGKLGSATSYDGNNDYYVFADDTDFALSSGQSFSVSFWTYQRDGNSGGNFSNSYSSTQYTPWYLSRSGSLPEIYLRTSSNGNAVATASTNIDNSWCKYCSVYDAQANELRLYLNGVLEATVTDVIKTNYGTNSGPFVIGRHLNRYIDSILEEFKFQKGTALSTNWITTEYNNQNDVASFWGTVEDAGGAPVVDRGGYLLWL